MLNPENAQLPRFKHDAHCCIFVGHFDSDKGHFDGYYCPREDSVIARAGDGGSDYISAPAQIVEKSQHLILKPILDKYNMMTNRVDQLSKMGVAL